MRAVGTSDETGLRLGDVTLRAPKKMKGTTRGRSLLTGGLLVAFVGLSYSSVIRRTSQNDLAKEFEREIAEEARLQAEAAEKRHT